MAPARKKNKKKKKHSFDFGVKYSAHFCNHLFSKDQMHASQQTKWRTKRELLVKQKVQ